MSLVIMVFIHHRALWLYKTWVSTNTFQLESPYMFYTYAYMCYLHLYLSSRWALQSEIIPVLSDRVRIFPVRPLWNNKTTHQYAKFQWKLLCVCVCVYMKHATRTCRRHWVASWGTCQHTAGHWPGVSGSVPAAGTGWSGRWPAGRCPAAARSVSNRADRTLRTPLACSAGPL